MDPRTPHYLRFVRTLALATTLALPACADDGGTVTTDEEGARPDTSARPETPLDTETMAPPAAARPSVAAETAEPTATAESDAGAEGDASYAGKSSGPLPPPEMPAAQV